MSRWILKVRITFMATKSDKLLRPQIPMPQMVLLVYEWETSCINATNGSFDAEVQDSQFTKTSSTNATNGSFGTREKLQATMPQMVLLMLKINTLNLLRSQVPMPQMVLLVQNCENLQINCSLHVKTKT